MHRWGELTELLPNMCIRVGDIKGCLWGYCYKPAGEEKNIYLVVWGTRQKICSHSVFKRTSWVKHYHHHCGDYCNSFTNEETLLRRLLVQVHGQPVQNLSISVVILKFLHCLQHHVVSLDQRQSLIHFEISKQSTCLIGSENIIHSLPNSMREMYDILLRKQGLLNNYKDISEK
jgi:hypothetical protein